MSSKKDQHKAGLPAKPRGQQTGFAGNPDQNREESKETPPFSGRRKAANKMFADDSTQQQTSNAAAPSSNTPSTPGQESGGHVGETGGEIAFKRKQTKRR